MTWQPNEIEIRNVLNLSPAQRYRHLIKRIADMGSIWLLWYDDGWALMADDNNRVMLPVWPHERYARLHATGDWAHYVPKPISLEDWREKWLPGMEQDGTLVAVFPTPAGVGVPVEPKRFAVDLTDELALYGEE